MSNTHRYEIISHLATGGMAEVFLARAPTSGGLQRDLVIKRLLPHLASQPRFLQMFFDEARTTECLRHGNIVQILDMGTMDGLPFLVMEHIDGYDLRTVLQRVAESNQRMPQVLAAHVMAEVCDALAYAHRKTDDDGTPLQIIHRDVNPANIFVSHDGIVKIGDFGLAKARNNLEHSEPGLIKGKFSYLSPEQVSGQTIDHRSDLFSLGTTLYEAICGERPFGGETGLATAQQIQKGEYKAPSTILIDCAPRLSAVIEQALQLDPEDRYQSASAIQADLSRYLEQQPDPVGELEMQQYLRELFGPQRRRSSLSAPSPGSDSISAAFGSEKVGHVADTPSVFARLKAAASPPVVISVAVVLFVAVWGLFSLSTCSPMPSVEATGSDARDAGPSPVSVQSWAAEPIERAVQQLEAVGRDGGPTKRRREAPRAVQTMATGANPVAATAPAGLLEILTEGAGRVFIDGVVSGRTPNFRKRLRPGRYQIEVRLDDVHMSHSGTVEIVAGETEQVTLTP